MAINKKHRDVEFMFENRSFPTFVEALEQAFFTSIGDDKSAAIDVVVYSAAGARWFSDWTGDEEFLQQYRDDPDMSVAQRWTVRGRDHGIVR